MSHDLNPLKEIPVAEITIGERHRKDMGDLQTLADSIDEIGLLHPIAVTPEYVLIFGERRLKAVRDLLFFDTIPAFIIDMDVLVGENDENELRKNFSVSERAEIARAFKARAGERRGNPDILPDVLPESGIPDKCPEFPKGEETRTAAARIAGFGSDRTLRQATAVVEQGEPGLVEAMDSGVISVNAAAATAKLPAAAQQEVVEKVKAGRKPRQAIREASGEATPPEEGPPADEAGVPLPQQALAAFAMVADMRKLCRVLGDAIKELQRIADSPCGKKLHPTSAIAHLKSAKVAVWQSRPAHVCPYCAGKAKVCKACSGEGWVTKSTFDAAPKREATA